MTACENGRSVPGTLADGTRARLSTVSFEGVAVPVIATGTRAVPVEPPPTCTGSRSPIDRVGVAGASRTLVSVAAGELRACDWTASSGWCGAAFARPRTGRPLDPRLSMTCRDAGGEQLGFLWIVPGRGTAFVVVARDGYAESYPVLRGGPVRVTTERVDPDTSSVTLTVSEHAQDGRLLRIRRTDAQVSG